MSMFARHLELSKSELLLLSKFLSPTSPSRFDGSEGWEQALGNPPGRSIKKFSTNGLIERPSLEGLIEGAFTISDLKKTLKSFGLPTSGRKAELVSKLIAHDAKNAEQMVQGLDLLVCSIKGSQLAREYLDQVKQDRKDVEILVLDALKRSRFEQASMSVAEFEANQVFPRGIGIDWKGYDPRYDVAILESIFNAVPRLLADVFPDALPKLRLRAGVLHLWGTNRLKGDLAEEFNSGTSLDVSTAARMFLFHAIHLKNLREYHKMQVKSIRVVTASDESVCNACKQLSEKVYLIDQVPELPFHACTSEMGCRCTTEVEEFSWE